jgi:hypothetical protein
MIHPAEGEMSSAISLVTAVWACVAEDFPVVPDDGKANLDHETILSAAILTDDIQGILAVVFSFILLPSVR